MEIGLGQCHTSCKFLFVMIHSGNESSQCYITAVPEGNVIKRNTIFGIDQQCQSNGILNELLHTKNALVEHVLVWLSGQRNVASQKVKIFFFFIHDLLYITLPIGHYISIRPWLFMSE